MLKQSAVSIYHSEVSSLCTNRLEYIIVVILLRLEWNISTYQRYGVAFIVLFVNINRIII